MKANLFLAVLVIAAQSNPITELYRGFISNLPMEPELQNSIMNDGLECLEITESNLMFVAYMFQHNILPGKKIDLAFQAIFNAGVRYAREVVPQCKKTLERIWDFLYETQRVNSKYYYERSEAYLYEAKLAQTFARAVEDLLFNRGYESGEKLATIYKFIGNLIDHELPHIASPDWDKYVPFNEERFINEFIPSFFRELGANEVQVNGYVFCIKTLLPVIRKAFSNPALNSGKFLPAANAFLEGTLEIIDALEKCERQVDHVPLQKLFGLFMIRPVEFLVRVSANTLLEKFAIIEAQLNMDLHGRQGEYDLAGKDFAKMAKAFLKGAVY